MDTESRPTCICGYLLVKTVRSPGWVHVITMRVECPEFPGMPAAYDRS